MVNKRRPVNHASAVMWMLAGSALVLTSVVLLNNFTDGPQDDGDHHASDIEFASTPKPKPKKVVEKPKPKKTTAQRSVTPPPAGLGSDIAGVDLGLPEFDLNAMGDLNNGLLGDMSDVVMTDDLVDVPPRPTQQPPMNYPAKARSGGITGYVVLNLLIDQNGEVEKVKVLESTPSGVFEDVAVSGVRQWRFQPAQYQGKEVKVWAKQKIHFDLG